jgi:hypothetical protein
MIQNMHDKKRLKINFILYMMLKQIISYKWLLFSTLISVLKHQNMIIFPACQTLVSLSQTKVHWNGM